MAHGYQEPLLEWHVFSTIKWREVDIAQEMRSLTAGTHEAISDRKPSEQERSRNDLGTLDDLHSHQDEKHFIFHPQTAFASLERMR